MRICLVTPHHLSFQPRAVREADTLTAAGHQVRVVSAQTDGELRDSDSDLMRLRRWKNQPVVLIRNGVSRGAWFTAATRAKAFGKLFQVGLRSEAVAARAYVRGLRSLRDLANSEPADWFIAHTQAALPIAARAARRWQARLGFDCEDLLAEMGADPSEIVQAIERAYLAQCDYVSVPSHSIAERLTAQYAISPPAVLYNVFPLQLAAGLAPPEDRPESPRLRLHWFGQTIGEGRGLEEALHAVAELGRSAEIHLRGRVSESYRSHLEEINRTCGSNGDLRFHPVVPPGELIRSMDQFDVGLALERPENEAYARTVTNKVFSYLLAGLAIAATDTPGNREVLSQVPGMGFFYPAGEPNLLAEKLGEWVTDRGSLRAAQRASWDAARRRFCWEVEEEKFLRLLEGSSSTGLAQIA